MHNRYSLLADQGAPAVVVNGKARSRFFVVCEHASRKIPAALGDLGLDRRHLASHIAWDIGAERVARGLAKRLGAPLVLQRYSRLVYDCNRPPEAESSIPAKSEATRIPGNEGLSARDRKARADELYFPFHNKVGEMLDQRIGEGLAPLFVTVHSFTPVYFGVERKVDLGVVHDADDRYANAVLAVAGADPERIVLRNEPYGPQDGVTHTLNVHCPQRGLANVMLEIRNDLITGKAGQDAWADYLAGVLVEAERLLAAAA
jgi:predicted N-formylglutamate amidohydrolase